MMCLNGSRQKDFAEQRLRQLSRAQETRPAGAHHARPWPKALLEGIARRLGATLDG
jgi:hypothetical protein